jgi:hypothetical protein
MRTVRKFPTNENLTMKIDRKTLALLIASFCGACSVSQGQDGLTLQSLADSDRVSEAIPAIPRLLDRVPMVEPASFGSLSDLGPSDSSGHISDDSDEEFASEASKVPATLTGYNADAAGVNTTSCSDGCSDSSIRCAPTAISSRDSSLGWLDFDTLLWWGRGLTNSPVIVGGSNTTAIPTNPLLGGSTLPIGNDLLFGLRADVGLWLDDCKNYGIGGRAWGILSNGQEQVITNGGNATGIQFYNSSLGIPDTYLVNIATAQSGANTGTISVLNELDVFSGELYLRSLLVGDRDHRMDLLTGYTFLRLDSGYRLESVVLDGIISGPPPVGTVTTLVDQFTTHNTFHGGHIGLASNLTRGRVGFGLSGKVAMGNMESTSIVSGQFNQVPPPPNVPTTANRGLFAQASNIGTLSRNQFTFIPEMNAKMRYRLGRAELGVGYTIIVLPEVAMAASQIDNNIDVLNILGTPISPMSKFNTESYFLHGLDLGLTFRF